MSLQPKTITQNAIFLAACINQAYNLADGLTFTLPTGSGYRLVKKLLYPPIFQSQIAGFIMTNKENIVVIIRGTRQTALLVGSDLDIFQTLYPFVRNSGLAQEGYVFDYKLLRKQILSTILGLRKKNPHKKLFLAGHSLGSGVVQVAAVDIAVNTPFKDPHIYSYGGPRIGDPQYVKVYDSLIKNSVRVANVHDEFTILPQPLLKPPFYKTPIVYKHVQKIYPLNFQCASVNPLRVGQLRNHNIQNYFNALRLHDNGFTLAFCKENPGFCPTITNDLCSGQSKNLT